MFLTTIKTTLFHTLTQRYTHKNIRMAKYITALRIFLIAATLSHVAHSAEDKFKSVFMDFAVGKWNVDIYRTPYKTGELPEEHETVFATLSRFNNTQIVDGSCIMNNERRYFRLSFNSENAGNFLIENTNDVTEEFAEIKTEDNDIKIKTPEEVEEEDEEADKDEEAETVKKVADALTDLSSLEFNDLFTFEITNYTTAHYISQGKFGEIGTYQLVLLNGAPFFTLNVYLDGKDYYISVIGKKNLPPPEPTFFQKYGMPLMMTLMMFTNSMGQKPQQQQQGEGEGEGEGNESGNGQAAAGAPAAAAASESSN